jgi:hypothetical protein
MVWQNKVGLYYQSSLNKLFLMHFDPYLKSSCSTLDQHHKHLNRFISLFSRLNLPFPFEALYLCEHYRKRDFTRGQIPNLVTSIVESEQGFSFQYCNRGQLMCCLAHFFTLIDKDQSLSTAQPVYNDIRFLNSGSHRKSYSRFRDSIPVFE